MQNNSGAQKKSFTSISKFSFKLLSRSARNALEIERVCDEEDTDAVRKGIVVAGRKRRIAPEIRWTHRKSRERSCKTSGPGEIGAVLLSALVLPGKCQLVLLTLIVEANINSFPVSCHACVTEYSKQKQSFMAVPCRIFSDIQSPSSYFEKTRKLNRSKTWFYLSM